MGKMHPKPSGKPLPKKKPGAVAEPAPSTALDTAFSVEVPAGIFKNTCLSLMDDVSEGKKEIVITKHGQPVAKLVAPGIAAPTGFGFLRGTIIAQADLVAPDWDAWGEPT